MAEPSRPRTPVLVMTEAIERADVPRLCARVCTLLQGDTDALTCDVGAIARPDAVVVEALVSMQLVARRLGCRITVRNADGGLRDLLAFMGLSEYVPAELLLEAERQAEQREQARGVEEEGDPRDPAV